MGWDGWDELNGMGWMHMGRDGYMGWINGMDTWDGYMGWIHGMDTWDGYMGGYMGWIHGMDT
eukprot:Awhi_evm1s8222